MKIGEVKPGEVVQLNSGGAKMVVMDTTASGRVIVAWQAGSESHVETYPAEALSPAKDK